MNNIKLQFLQIEDSKTQQNIVFKQITLKDFFIFQILFCNNNFKINYFILLSLTYFA